MNIKDSIISIFLLTTSIFLGMLGVVGVIKSFQELLFSPGGLIDGGLGILFGILLFLLARSLYKKARKIRERGSETEEKKGTQGILGKKLSWRFWLIVGGIYILWVLIANFFSE